jgi:LuxR family transcriptional regulator, maltose regulon positive regulatory protein
LNDTTEITSRELAILKLLKKGFSNERISRETGITVNTVKFHLKKIYKKLNVINRVQAINELDKITNQKTK